MLLEFHGISSPSHEYVPIAAPREHGTKDLWDGNERLLRPIRHIIWILKHEDILDQRVKHLIDHSGFGHLLKFKNIDFNHLLFTTLVERW